LIVLDTHAVFWLAQTPELLSDRAIEAIASERQADGVAIADKSLWEMAMMISRGHVKVRTSMREFLQEVERNFTVLPITGAIAERAMEFSKRYPKDPTDRLIGATAVAHGLQLVTKDEGIRGSGEVNCVW
jgi:PIN domain nuclease of toxin-antitoxin system